MNKKIKKIKAFTLLELLIVVAIIGVLTSIVLAVTSNTRSKGSNTAIKQQMQSILIQGSLYFDATGTYGTSVTDGLCRTAQVSDSMFNSSNGNGADTTVALLSKIGQIVGDPSLNNIQKTLCYVQPDSFLVGVLLTNNEGVYCVDYKNNKKLYPGATNSPDNYAMRDPTSSASPQPFICR